MEKDFHAQKISLLKEKVKEQDPSPLEFRYNLVGIEVQWWVHGVSKREIVDFLKSYFHYFPSLNTNPKVTIHFYSSSKDNGGPGDAAHEMWNESSEAFVFHIEENERFVKQRDFVAMQNLTTKIIRATGPVLDLICCDSIDNLVQFALTTSLIESHVLPLHSATVVVDGKAYVFYGESGAGKSTLAKQSYELDRYKVLG
ncbi:MAG: hypothetical protein H7333_07310, partial [Bdellovibrionales bacterium]|nr:hypothetical protein [Oligoflexia bacterium]